MQLQPRFVRFTLCACVVLANAAPEDGDGGPAAGVSTAGGGAARSDRRVPPESPHERLSHGTLPVRHRH